MQGWRHALARNPLAWVALAAATGVVLADQLRSLPSLWLMSAAMVACGCTCWKPRPWLLALSAVLVFGFIHQVCLASARDHPLRQVLQSGQRVSATLTGCFVRAPMLRDDAPGKRQAQVRVSRIELTAMNQRIFGASLVRVWLNDPSFIPEGGEYELKGTLSLMPRPWNPSIYDPQAAALRQGMIAEFSPREMRLLGKPEFSLRLTMLKWAEQCRDWITRQLAVGIEDQEMPRTLITTMALGTSEAGSAELEEPFRNSGTLHIFAVSGLHVGLLAVIGWILLKNTGIGRSRALCLLLPLMFGYAFITGWVPSAARAAFMSAVMLAAPLANRSSRLINGLGLAALLLLSGDTLQFFQPGFQLSFGVLAAIAIGATMISRPFKHLAELDPFLPPMLASWHANASVWLRRNVISLLATSTAAWAGSLPLMVAYFHQCTPVSILANCVLVPLSFASLFTVALSLLAALFGLGSVQLCLNNANWVLAHLMMFSANGFASVPGGHFPLNPPTLTKSAPWTLRVLSMPIGEGAQMLSSEGRHWLLDCGSAQHSRRSVLPFLRQQGIHRLQGLVLSHADAEHMSAAVELMKRYGVSEVFTGLHEPWRYDSRQTAMWQLAASNRGHLQAWEAGQTADLGRARLRVLYPSAADRHDKADDRALVVRIDCGRMRLLWCSDAGFLAEKAVLDRWPKQELQADVLLRNQHASDWSALPEFLQAVQPRVVISSNAQGVVEQRLPKHLRDWCQQNEVRLLDLNETGMVQVQAWEDRLELGTWLPGETFTIPEQ